MEINDFLKPINLAGFAPTIPVFSEEIDFNKLKFYRQRKLMSELKNTVVYKHIVH